MIAEFTRLMDRLGPFEPAPQVAVGVSGGADSLALCLLLKAWTNSLGGSLLALTVDHGLRHDAAVEAVQVGFWLKERGIEHDVLRWEGAKPASGIQAGARDARYRLLTERCHAEGILHLALAHHREDQAETVLLRFAHGSGVDGLSGMSALRETGSVRFLRPLLSTSRDRLRAFLTEVGQPWVEDPSNQSPAYARARLRGMAEVLSGEGWSAERAADTARRLGRARSVLEIRRRRTGRYGGRSLAGRVRPAAARPSAGCRGGNRATAAVPLPRRGRWRPLPPKAGGGRASAPQPPGKRHRTGPHPWRLPDHAIPRWPPADRAGAGCGR